MAETVTWICWGAVAVTWIAGAVYGARAGRGQSHLTRTAGLLRIAMVVAAALVFRLAWHELRRVTDDSWWLVVPGLVVLVVSTGFTIWARLRLGRMWSAAPDMLRADHALRTDGPYAITRHPIYTGLLGMLVGTVLLNGLGVSLAFLVVGIAAVATRIPIEERLMSETFPDEYASYRERVPRLVPGLRLHRRSH